LDELKTFSDKYRLPHTGFRLVPTSVSLNKLKPHNSFYFALFHWIR